MTVVKAIERKVIFPQKCGQRLSGEGKILVSKMGWRLRIFTLVCLGILIGFNFRGGFEHGDLLVVYATLIPVHTLAVFSVGWIFYKNPANGKVGNDLVSVIIPVYNQESMIKTVIDAIFSSTYKNVEVIAVNDGSKDGSKVILDNLRNEYPSLKVIHKDNEGKRKAVATGFYESKGKVVVLIDSDSVIEEHAIEEVMKSFNADPQIGGVVGYAKVWNSQKNILTKCQDAWYDYAFNIHKTCESTFGCVLCCSGCLAAYRREAIANYIPYWIRARIHNSDDRDLTAYAMATPWAKTELAPIQRELLESMSQYDDSEDRGLTAQTLVEWKTVYAPTAVVYTEVPDRFKTYMRQQIRWKKGFVRSNFFVSAFFWRKNPIISLIYYLEFMTTFSTPLIIFAVYFYTPLILQSYLIPGAYVIGQLLIGFAAGLDYRFRDANSKNWKYKPIMNLIASFILPWLLFPALWTYRKNQWLTR